jgi:histidinol-phosphate aminotransferase
MNKSTDNPSLWSPLLNGLDPYVPGEQPATQGLVKLNTNESPYPPSPAALAAITDAAGESLRLYPDPESSGLKAVIADYFSVTSENVFVGNGSDEVLAHAFNAFFRQY